MTRRWSEALEKQFSIVFFFFHLAFFKNAINSQHRGTFTVKVCFIMYVLLFCVAQTQNGQEQVI